MRKITVSSADFTNLQEGKHACIDGVKRFGKLIVTNKDNPEQTLIARVTQVGGIATKDAAIIKDNN